MIHASSKKVEKSANCYAKLVVNKRNLNADLVAEGQAMTHFRCGAKKSKPFELVDVFFKQLILACDEASNFFRLAP